MSAEISNRISDVDAEESRAISAEASLAGDLSSEISNRESAISTEESTRLAADASIAADLSSDIEALADVDGTTIVLNGDTNQIELKETIAAPASGTRTFEGIIALSDGLIYMNGRNIENATMVQSNITNTNLINSPLGEVYLGNTLNADLNVITNLPAPTADGDAANKLYVDAAMSAEIEARISGDESLEVALSTEVSYLIANTDLGSIDSFAEVVADLSSEVSRAESAEASIVYDLSRAYAKIMNFNETPDGVITSFTFKLPIVKFRSELIHLNGLLLDLGDYDVDFLLDGNGNPEVDGNGIVLLSGITFINAPLAGDKVIAHGVC